MAGKDGVPNHTSIELLYMNWNLNVQTMKQLYVLEYIVTLYSLYSNLDGSPQYSSRICKIAPK